MIHSADFRQYLSTWEKTPMNEYNPQTQELISTTFEEEYPGITDIKSYSYLCRIGIFMKLYVIVVSDDDKFCLYQFGMDKYFLK